MVSWKPQEEYVMAKCQRVAQPHINPLEISFFRGLGPRTNQKKAFKNQLGRRGADRGFLWAQKMIK